MPLSHLYRPAACALKSAAIILYFTGEVSDAFASFKDFIIPCAMMPPAAVTSTFAVIVLSDPSCFSSFFMVVVFCFCTDYALLTHVLIIFKIYASGHLLLL